jgi:disulfide oxidoreductase YuzD
MPREVLVVGYPPDASEWVGRAVQVVEAALAGRFGGKVQVRYLASTAPELAAYPEVAARLAAPGVWFPLVVVDGRVVAEGGVSAGLIVTHLVSGQIPMTPDGHMVSRVASAGAPPAAEGPNRPERGVWRCVGRWWRRWWRSSSS